MWPRNYTNFGSRSATRSIFIARSTICDRDSSNLSRRDSGGSCGRISSIIRILDDNLRSSTSKADTTGFISTMIGWSDGRNSTVRSYGENRYLYGLIKKTPDEANGYSMSPVEFVSEPNETEELPSQTATTFPVKATSPEMPALTTEYLGLVVDPPATVMAFVPENSLLGFEH